MENIAQDHTFFSNISKFRPYIILPHSTSLNAAEILAVYLVNLLWLKNKYTLFVRCA